MHLFQKFQMNFDLVTEQLLVDFAVDIVKKISLKTKIDPDVIAACIPGLIHSHWFIADNVAGCRRCERASGWNQA